ncbi:MAG: hypothetical protein ACRBB4_15740 [Neptuniibacter sp.]
MATSKNFLIILVSLGSFFLTGCKLNPEKGNEPRTVEFADQVATVNVSIDAIAPWSVYSDALTTDFKLNSDQAFQKVLPNTSFEENIYKDMIRAALSLSPYQTSKEGESSSESSSEEVEIEGGERTSSSEQSIKNSESLKEKRIDGVIDFELLKGEPSNQLSASRFNGNDLKTLQSDPMLQYHTAQALYQEVKIINSYLKHAVNHIGYKAFFVRMSVHINPKGSNLPYDTNVNVSFFNDSKSQFDNELETLVNDFRINASLYNKAITDNKNAIKMQTELKEAYPTVHSYVDNLSKVVHIPATKKPPIVLPLLVRDNLEAAVSSHTTNTIREFAFALTLLRSGSGLGGSFNSDFEKLRSVFGRNLNSLYSVAKLGDNTLKVHIGAGNNGLGNPEMVTRNHNVTFVLLIPKGENGIPAKIDEKVNGVQLTEFVHAIDGSTIYQNTASFLQNQSRSLFKNLLEMGVLRLEPKNESKKINCGCEWESSLFRGGNYSCHDDVDGLLDLLAKYAEQGDQPEFYKSIAEFNDESDDCKLHRSLYAANALWANFQKVVEKTPNRYFSFELPTIEDESPNVHWAAQSKLKSLIAFASDKSIDLRIPSVPKVEGYNHVVSLCTIDDDKQRCMLPSETSYAIDTGMLSLKYPPIAGFGIEPAPNILKLYMLLIKPNGKKDGSIKELTEDEGMTVFVSSLKQAATKTNPKKGFGIKTAAQKIIAKKDGKGSVSLSITLDKTDPAPPIILSIVGAEVASVNATGTLNADNRIQVSKSGILNLELRNLLVNTKLTITSADKKKRSGPEISVPIVDG